MKYFFRILEIVGVVVFFAIVLVTILFAEGYQYDSKSKDLVKKSVIYFEGLPEHAEVYLDGEKKEVTLPRELRVSPGEHDIEIKSKDFNLWKKHVNVPEDTIVRFKEIRLIANGGGANLIEKVQPVAGWSVRSFSQNGVFLENDKLHYLKYYDLDNSGDFWLEDATNNLAEYLKILPVTRTKIGVIKKSGRLGTYDLEKGEEGDDDELKNVFSDIKNAGNKFFAIEKGGEIWDISINNLKDAKVFFDAGTEVEKFIQLQETDSYFAFLLERKNSQLMVITKKDGTLVIKEEGIGGAYIEEGNVYYTVDNELIVYSLEDKKIISHIKTTNPIKWLSRIGRTNHFLFVTKDLDSLYCDEDFENCTSLTKLDSAKDLTVPVVASSSNEEFFIVHQGQFALMDFGQQSQLLPFLRDLVSVVF